MRIVIYNDTETHTPYVESGEEINPGMIITAQERFDQAWYQALADSEAARLPIPTNHELQARGDPYAHGGGACANVFLAAGAFALGVFVAYWINEFLTNLYTGIW